MSSEMENAKQTFKEESEELLQDMESSLLTLEDEPDNEDAINAIFRAAHTIKGTSGIFGFDDVVEFTHVVETILDQVRAHQIQIDSNLVATLLSSGDHIKDLVEHAISDTPISDELIDYGTALIKLLNGLDKGSLNQDSSAELVEVENPVIRDSNDSPRPHDNWHISLRFSREVYRNGMDPISFIHYLQKLGHIHNLVTLFDELPIPEEYEAESCYLGFEIEFETKAEKGEIEAVFEFVHDDCDIYLLPPASNISKYIDLIQELPENDLRLGDILIKGGAVTRKELEDALKTQLQEETVPKPPIGEVLVNEGTVPKQVLDAAVQKQSTIRQKKQLENRSIRVDAQKLDLLINLVGELVISSASSYLQAQQSGDDDLIETISNTSRLIEEIRDSALNLRMVQIAETFTRFQRVVRDVSIEIEKEIRLQINGGDTELDKTVIEKIGDPLMHLVRNAMDHGIETAEVRQQQGKTEKGCVSLNAYHDSGSIVIEVSDNGAGLDKEKIINKATERGLIQLGQNLAEADIFNLIFEPGFSTAEAVTNLSGRGVGMDVVKRNIQALRGSIEVESTLGKGTTVRIRLPLTLAIIDGFLVGVGDASYVVPLDMVVECVELDNENNASIENNYINLRGEVLPFIQLSEMFNGGRGSRYHNNIVVVQYAGFKAGLVVDKLLGEFQTVIKPLGKLFKSLKGISGSTILGSGEVAVILDVPMLVNHAVTQEEKLISATKSTPFMPKALH